MATPTPANASSDFVKYLTLEKVKSIDMPIYDYSNSLRVWLKEFELQATFVGILDLDACTVQLGKFMPTTIKNWLPTQAPDIRQSWKLLTEQLLLQFGKPADEEFREFKQQLRNCKQLPDASIRIHSAQWLHLLNFLPKNHLSDDRKIAQFTQSLHDRSLRSTLVAFVEIKEIKSVEEVIAKAIDIESKAKLLSIDDNFSSGQAEVKAHVPDDPMEVDYVNKQKQSSKKFYRQKRNFRPQKTKDTPFIWEAEQEAAFQALKQQLAQLPLLKQPDFERTFHLYCDAANTAGIAVVLCQHYQETPYPLSFASRALTAAERNYTVRELEALAIVFGIQKHRMYLERRKFFVYTDHSSLQWLLNSNQDKQPRLWRWCLMLQSYDFEVKYIPGTTNHVADALSRAINATDVTAQVINWELEQRKDKDLALLLNNTNDKYRHYKVLKNILYRILPKPRDVSQNNIYKVVPSHLIPTILDLHHDSKFAGHGGITKTKQSIANANLWWNRIDEDIKLHIQKCDICQHIKGHKHNNYQQQPTAGTQPFHKIAMDHFGPLPGTPNGYKYILVIIDTFTKYVEIYPSKTTNAMELANLVYNSYILRHGVPHIIISDNGPPFGSGFMHELAKYTGIEIHHTPPHHPQSNGIVERYMSTLRQMLLIYANDRSIVGQWDQHLRIVRFVYNTMYHHSTSYSPFELTHGRHARTPLTSIAEQHSPAKYNDQHTPQSKFAADLKARLDIAFQTVN
ncbi:conserved hypothetical protein, partial [Mucor ambiguus]